MCPPVVGSWWGGGSLHLRVRAECGRCRRNSNPNACHEHTLPGLPPVQDTGFFSGQPAASWGVEELGARWARGSNCLFRILSPCIRSCTAVLAFSKVLAIFCLPRREGPGPGDPAAGSRQPAASALLSGLALQSSRMAF